MIFIASAVAAIVFFRVWHRLAELQDAVVNLSARVESLERLRQRDDGAALKQAAPPATAPGTPRPPARPAVQVIPALPRQTPQPAPPPLRPSTTW